MRLCTTSPRDSCRKLTTSTFCDLRDDLLELVPEDMTRKAKRLVIKMESTLNNLREGVDLLREAAFHEMKFAKFANRNYAYARAMEEDDNGDDDLEAAWLAVISAKEKEEKEKKRRERSLPHASGSSASSSRASKPRSSGGGGTGGRTVSSGLGSASGSSRAGPSSSRHDRGGAKPHQDRPCFLCGKSGHWHRDCPNKKSK